ncbi:MAG: hypothetical protein ABIT69_01540 [Sphingomicrobium sp.]
MTNPNLLRPGLTAIAAVLALSSTPLLAQEVTAPPATTPQSVPAADPAPAAAPALTTTPTEFLTTPDPLAPTAAVTPKATAKTTILRRTTVTRTVAPIAAKTRIVAPSAIAPVAAPAPVEAALAPAAVPMTPPPVAMAPPAPVTAPATLSDETLPIAGAAGLGLLALAGAAFAMRRRKRRNEDEVTETIERQEPAPMLAAEPAVPRRAFDWSPSGPVAVGTTVAASDAMLAPDSSHFDAAMSGPTPGNPSLSLKKRLKRAAFFEQRERQVAAGIAKPLPLDAGLPETMTRNSPAPSPAKPRQNVFSSSGGYRLQPV